MPTTSQIEARLLQDYQDSLDANLYFKNFMEANAPKKVDYGVELCFLPEFMEGEEYVFPDERYAFKADADYLSRKERSAAAMAEISDENGNYIITKESTESFFERYLQLYHELFPLWNYGAFYPFRQLFFMLITWIEFYKIGPKAGEALQQLNIYNADDIEDWLIEYNRLFYCNGILWGSFFEIIDGKSHLYKFKSEEFTAFLQGREITDCIEFGESYSFYEKKYFPSP